MKKNRMSRAGIIGTAVLGMLAASWILPPFVHRTRKLCPVRPDGVPEAGALAQFARRYGVDCTVCHSSLYQLNSTGYKFRVAGLRMPDEIGADAKFANYGDVTSVRLRETYKITESATTSAGVKTPATNGLSSAGVNMYPIFGAFGKYWALETELSFKATAATVGASNATMRGTFPINSDMFVGVRTGLIGAFEGYGAADRGVGLLSPGWKPSVSDANNTGIKYNSAVPGGEGIEGSIDWKDTHASVAIRNGYNSKLASSNEGEDNYNKDLSVFVQQMIGESAVAAYFYSGTAGYNYTAAEAASSPFSAQWMNHYTRGALYGTLKALPNDKLSLLVGAVVGKDHLIDTTTHDASETFTSNGWFAQVQSVLHPHFTAALGYGTNRPNTKTAGNRSSDITLSLAAPYQNGKFAVDFQTKRTQAFGAGKRDVTANTIQAEWMLNY